MNTLSLIDQAIDARKNAYAPYSHHRVGAVVLTDNGKTYTGCNIENCVFLGECAERVAIYKALSEGEKKIIKLVVVTGNKELSPPCGVCRQVMREFSSNLEIIISNPEKKFRVVHLIDLLPESFGPDSFRQGQD